MFPPHSASSQEPKEVRLNSKDKFDKDTFGDMIPYGDPAWYQGWNSHFYNDSHRRFRAVLREFMEKEVTPFVHEWDESGGVPNSFFEKAFIAGFLPGVAGKSRGGGGDIYIDIWMYTDVDIDFGSFGLMNGR